MKETIIEKEIIILVEIIIVLLLKERKEIGINYCTYNWEKEKFL